MRMLLGGVAVALAVVTTAPAHAAPSWTCAPGFEAVCTVGSLPCRLDPKHFACPL